MALKSVFRMLFLTSTVFVLNLNFGVSFHLNSRYRSAIKSNIQNNFLLVPSSKLQLVTLPKQFERLRVTRMFVRTKNESVEKKSKFNQLLKLVATLCKSTIRVILKLIFLPFKILSRILFGDNNDKEPPVTPQSISVEPILINEDVKVEEDYVKKQEAVFKKERGVDTNFAKKLIEKQLAEFDKQRKSKPTVSPSYSKSKSSSSSSASKISPPPVFTGVKVSSTSPSAPTALSIATTVTVPSPKPVIEEVSVVSTQVTSEATVAITASDESVVTPVETPVPTVIEVTSTTNDVTTTPASVTPVIPPPPEPRETLLETIVHATSPITDEIKHNVENMVSGAQGVIDSVENFISSISSSETATVTAMVTAETVASTPVSIAEAEETSVLQAPLVSEAVEIPPVSLSEAIVSTESTTEAPPSEVTATPVATALTPDVKEAIISTFPRTIDPVVSSGPYGPYDSYAVAVPDLHILTKEIVLNLQDSFKSTSSWLETVAKTPIPPLPSSEYQEVVARLRDAAVSLTGEQKKESTQ